MTRTAHVLAMARTPIGRRAGGLKTLTAHELGGIAIRATVERSGLGLADVNPADVILGCTLASTGNTARVAALEAGLPVETPSLTIDRQCGSGMNAVALAADAIRLGAGCMIAGGAESMTNEPYLLAKQARSYSPMPPEFLRRALSVEEIGDPTMGITAENLARRFQISRAEQDEYALQSQQRYADHADEFLVDAVPVTVRDGKQELTVAEDEHPRPDTTLDALAKLRPAFEQDGTVTAGNASGINDAGAALLLGDDELVSATGMTPLATVGSWAVAGVDPNVMGIGPVPAIRKLLQRTGRELADYAVLEINEAFAVQVLACARELELDAAQLNAWGGAIAHGHPIAATGAILSQKVIRQLRARGGGLGLLAACIGGGQGIAVEIAVDAG